MPKHTTDQINQELAKLAGSGFVCAEYYLKRELRRREASSRNAGRKPLYDDPKHQRQREASARYRAKRITDSSQSYSQE